MPLPRSCHGARHRKGPDSCRIQGLSRSGAQEIHQQRLELVQAPVKEVSRSRQHVQSRLARLAGCPTQHGIGRHHVVCIALDQHPLAVGRVHVAELITDHRRRDRDELFRPEVRSSAQRHERAEGEAA